MLRASLFFVCLLCASLPVMAQVESGLWQALSGIKDTATLVLVLALGGLGWLHVTSMRESRVDRQALVDLLQKNNEALNGIKNVLSAMTGKPL